MAINQREHKDNLTRDAEWSSEVVTVRVHNFRQPLIWTR